MKTTMKNRKPVAVTLVILAAPLLLTPAARAAGPMGPPAASLAKGQLGTGIEYSYGELALDLSSGQDNTGAALAGFRVDPFTTHTINATVGYGLLDQWEIGVKAGAIWGDWDLNDNEFEGDAGPYLGGFTQGTFYRNEKLEVGGVFHVDWNRTSGDNQGPGWTGDTEVEFVHLRLAIGPKYTFCEGFAVYAGPFWQYIDGEKRYDERTPFAGYQEKYDVEARSDWGDFLGVEANLSEQIRLSADLQLTPHDWIVGGSFRWQW